MSWEADFYDDNDPVEEDVFEDGKEFEDSYDDDIPPAKKKGKENFLWTLQQEERRDKITRWCRMLNESKKKSVVARISSTSNKEIAQKSLSDATKQVSAVSNSLKGFCESVAPATII